MSRRATPWRRVASTPSPLARSRRADWALRNECARFATQARAVAFFKGVGSLGTCVGFALVPAERVPPAIQLALTVAFALVGVAFTLLELPPHKRPPRAGAPPGAVSSTATGTEPLLAH